MKQRYISSGEFRLSFKAILKKITPYLLIMICAILPLSAEAQIERSADIHGGYVIGVIGDEDLYAVTYNHLYRFETDHQQWTPLKLNIKFERFDRILVQDSVIVLDLTDTIDLNGESVYRLRSVDRGESWESLTHPTEPQSGVVRVSGRFLVAYDQGWPTHISDDAGVSWDEFTFDESMIGSHTSTSIARSGSSYLVTTPYGLYTSEDGLNWNEYDTEVEANIRTIAGNSDGFYLMTLQADVYFTAELDNEWDLIFEHPSEELNFNSHLSVGNRVYLTSSDETPHRVFELDHETGEASTIQMPDDSNRSISQAGDVLYTIIYPGIYYSEDNGETWLEKSLDGIRSFSFNQFEVIEQGYITVSNRQIDGNPYHVKMIETETNSWSDAFFVPGSRASWVTAIERVDDGYLLASHLTDGNYHIYRSDDEGDTWSELSEGVAWDIRSIGSRIFATGDTRGIVIFSQRKMMRSDDEGENWSTLEITGSSERVWGFFESDGILYAQVESEVYRSADEGDSWESILELDGFMNSAVRIGPALYIGSGDGLMKMPDDGSEWQTVSELPVTGGVARGPVLFFSSGDKLFEYDAEENSVTEIELDFPGTINRLKIADNKLHVASNTGMWAMDISGLPVSIEDRIREVPNSTVLNQNYPNPFNPTTTISYRLPSETSVHLAVYDMLGRQVETIVNSRQSAGEHSVTFDASRLSSGMYIYRLQTGDFTDSKSLFLIK